MKSQSNKTEEAMHHVARIVAERHIKSGMVLGLGSGAAVSKFARALGEMIRKRNLKDLSVVPSSLQAWLLARENSLPLNEDSARCPETVNVAVDGADQVCLRSRSMIKGGGGALLREKIILAASKHSYILVDSSKLAPKLNRPVPVEVVQFAMNSIKSEILRELKGSASLRKLDKGYPFYTESGNIILDCEFKKGIQNSLKLEQSIKSIAGVVEAGIFNCHVDKFYVGTQEGLVESH